MHHRCSLIIVIAMSLLVGGCAPSSTDSGEPSTAADSLPAPIVGKDMVVAFAYTMTNPQGQQVGKTPQDKPMVYLHGSGKIIAGLAQALEGKSAGESFEVTLAPKDAYGDRDEKLVVNKPRSDFDGIPNLAAGMELTEHSDQGDRIVRVVAVSEDQVTLDTNHPLAGIPLTFDVKVLNVRKATPEEIEHGHVHGPGGHQH